MRSTALLAMLLALSGCAVFHLAPPPPVRPGPATTAAPPSGGPAAGTHGGSAISTHPPGPPAAPAASGPAPSSAPTVAAPVPGPAPSSAPTVAAPTPGPAPSSAPAVAAPAPGPPLTASLPPEEMRRLRDNAQRRIDHAERLLRQLEGRPFASKELETLRLAQSLVEQARKALGGEEFERAANLATKAQTLAEDLSRPR